MWITIIILAYVANVFLNRWLNKQLFRVCKYPSLVWFWFIPIFGTPVLLLLLLENTDWFTGKHW